jgi:pimeloyl-ACP methyl ester carboxylesterase
VLLHGGLSDSSAWGLQVPALTERFETYAFDRRGHGTSPDTDEPFHYEAMAAETIAFIEDVVGGPSHLVGWSDGGIIALLVSLARPDLVRRQVVIGTNFHHEGLMPEFDIAPEDDAMVLIRSMYEAVAPDPSHFDEVLAKSMRMFTEEPTLTAEDLRRVAAPTLVLAGDDDCIYHGHTVTLFESIPDAQLAIVPGTSHMIQFEKPVLVNQLIIDFLTETAPPGTMFPIRRR